MIDLWNKYKDHMAEDILHQKRLRTSNANLQINEEMYNEALILIEDMCLMLIKKINTISNDIAQWTEHLIKSWYAKPNMIQWHLKKLF